MLQNALLEQVKGYFSDLNSQFVLEAAVSPKHPKRAELISLLESLCECSPKITCEQNTGNGLEFSIIKDNKNTGIKYRSTPNGREFGSLILAILHADGKGKLPEKSLVERIKNINTAVKFTTYMSLSCELCSDVVESLNLMTVLNEQFSHEIVDGDINKMEIIDKEIKALPTVYINGKLLFIGKFCLEEILDKTERKLEELKRNLP